MAASSKRSRESSGSRSSTGSKAQRATNGRQRSKEGGANGSATANRGTAGEGLSSLAEQLANRIIKPLGLVVLTRERIQETLDDAADRGRLTRSDANELGLQLVQRGRQQTEQLLADIERLLARGAGLARRKVGGESTFPILDYDELTAGEVQRRLSSLSPPELRRVRDYEHRHANRKSVLATIEKQLG